MSFSSAGVLRYFGGDTMNGYYTFYSLVFIYTTCSLESKGRRVGMAVYLHHKVAVKGK